MIRNLHEELAILVLGEQELARVLGGHMYSGTVEQSLKETGGEGHGGPISVPGQ